MSGDVLRKAVTLMRERAEAATVFTDAKTGAPLRWVNGLSGEVFDMGAAQVAQAIDHGTARHIGSWHPAVALAVADLLSVWVDHDLLLSSGSLSDEKAAILAVATAYLGSDA